MFGQGSGGAIDLNLKIPAAGWYPVYIFSKGASGVPLYGNVKLTSTSTTSSSDTYGLTAPASFSSWLIVQDSTPPNSVSASDTGALPRYSSLSSLGSTLVGEHWTGSTWQNMAQTGWYYDDVNKLLYIHFVGQPSVSITVSL